jgi:hypothetical protein
MQLSEIEKKVVANMHSLPSDKQHSILEFSLFLRDNFKKNRSQKNQPSFAVSLKEFLHEVESEPLNIDTSIFDRDRQQGSGREIDL